MTFWRKASPNLSVDFGPGSMAGYLGSEIVFDMKTVWFREFVEDWLDYPDLAFDPENKWFQKHMEVFRRVCELSGGDFYVGIPDIMENLDVLVSMRGAQDTIFDMMDEPEELLRRVNQVQDLYFTYYDAFYDLAKQMENGKESSCYTVFQIWGEGKIAKLQCDFSAMISPRSVPGIRAGSPPGTGEAVKSFPLPSGRPGRHTPSGRYHGD